MKLGVTGGSGVVGTALVRLLVDEGHEVAALSRGLDSDAHVLNLGARPVRGDITAPETLDALCAGADGVFHVAGRNEMCTGDLEGMREVNVVGTENVLRAAERNGVRRIVHTSSVVTLGEGEGAVGAEDTIRSRPPVSDYESTKSEAELRALSGEYDVEIVVVNPASVQGPGRSEGTGALLARAVKGSVPVVVDSMVSIVDIRDCALGHSLAMDRGMSGSRYVLSGATLRIRELIRLIGDVTGRPQKPVFLKPAVLRGLAPVAAFLAKAAGKRPALCPESARVLTSHHRYDGSRATRDLGLVYRPIEETLADFAEWLGRMEEADS